MTLKSEATEQKKETRHNGVASPTRVGDGLRDTIGPVLREIPGCSMRPTDISRRLDVSRVMVGRVLRAVEKKNPIEILTSIPGPESLRLIVRAAELAGVSSSGQVQSAIEAIDAFDHLIRDQYGTRGALSAALSVDNADERGRFEQASRYQAFKGMSQVLGVESKTWLTCMMMTPSADSEHGIDISTIHGTTGLRRLRSDTSVNFVYGVPPKYVSGRQIPKRMDLDLSPYFTNIPAPLDVLEENGQIVNTFAPEVVGKDAIYDMFAGVHVKNGSNRFAAPGRTCRGTVVIPDVPVTSLVSDVILHGDIFEGIEPQLLVYNTMGRGGADIEDPKRFVDRVETNDEIVDLGTGLSNIKVTEIPKYQQMVRFLCEKTGFSPDSFRVHRLHIQYPVYGFQYAIVYKVPANTNDD